MKKLREDYIDGEKFYAEDMNKITHIINKLDDGSVFDLELPETGETGVIYVTPKFNYPNDVVNALFLYPLKKPAENQYVVYHEKVDGNVDIHMNVGDIVRASSTGETWIATSVNPDVLKIDNGYVYGILSSIQVQKDHYYQITGAYTIKVIGPDAMYVHNWKIFTFSETQNTNNRYYFDRIPSFFGINSGVLTKTFYDAGIPIIEHNGELTVESDMLTQFVFELGDKFRYIGQTESGGTIIVPTSVDENNLIISMREFRVNGIVSYTPVKTNQCYEVTGIYHYKYIGEEKEEMERIKRSYGYYYDIQVLTFKEIDNDSSITNETEFFNSFRYCMPYFKIDEEYSKKYKLLDGTFIGI